MSLKNKKMSSNSEADQAYISRLLNPGDDNQERSIRTSEYIAVRDSLPKTGLTNVILRLNVCIQRQFEIEKAKIHRREKRYNLNFAQNRRAFLDQQAKKSRVWKSQDEMQMHGMKLPSLNPSSARIPRMHVLYTNPKYPRTEDTKTSPLMPYETLLRRSRTEILQHNHDIYTTKLPAVIDVDELQLKRFNTFCAQDFIENATKDSRFQILDKTLQRKKSGSPTRFTKWLAKRFPAKPKDSTTYGPHAMPRRPPKTTRRMPRRQANIIFPSLQKTNREKPKSSQSLPVQGVIERGARKPWGQTDVSGYGEKSRGSSQRTYITEEDSDCVDEGEVSRKFQSPSHKQTFAVKKKVVSK
jgi:hypothetical protein